VILAASVALLLAGLNPRLEAASGTWIGNTSNWTEDTNWSGASYPNGSTDVATFDGTAVSANATITGMPVLVGGISINVGSPTFNITLDGASAAATLTFDGGVSNGSGNTQNFTATGSAGNLSGFTFNNSASAGTQTVWTVNDQAFVRFSGTSDGGTAAFVVNAGGALDVSLRSGSVTVGSITGAGSFFLGANNLTTGADNTSTTVTGIIQDAGTNGGVGGSLTKVGTGTLILTNSNSYTGATTVSGGILQAGAVGTFAPSSTFVVEVGGTLDLNNFNQTIGALGSTGGSGGVVSLGTATLTVGSNNSNSTFGGTITGTGPVVKVGAGNLTLTAANSYSGGTTLDNGGLIVDNGGALGSGVLTITSAGGTTTLGSNVNDTTLNNQIVFQGGSTGVSVTTAGLGQNFILNGNVDLNGATRTFTGLTLGGQLQFGAGGISGNGGVNFVTNFVNPGEYMAFIYNASNTNTYTGKTTVGNGAFLVLQSNAINGAMQGNVLVEGNGVIDYLGNGTPSFSSEQIADNATVTVNSSGQTLNGTAFAGLDFFNAKGTETIGSLFGNGTVFLASATLAVGSGNFSGVISDGTHVDQFTMAPLVGGKLTKYSSGTLILSGANTYTGATSVTEGTLQAGAANSFSPNSAVLLSFNTTLDLNNFDQSIGSLADGVGGGTVNLGSATLTTGNDNTNTSFSGTILGSGGLTKVGTGTFTLLESNLYTGATTVFGGTLQAGVTNTIPFNSAVLVDVAGTLDLNNFNQTIGSLADGLSGGGTVNLGSATLTTGTDNTSTSFSGTINGTGSVAKIGTGTFTLTSANTYEGGTLLDNGGLFIDNNDALGTGPLIITSTGGPTTLGSNVPGTNLANTVEVRGSFSIATNVDAGNVGNQNFTFGGPMNLSGGTWTITGVTPSGQVHFSNVISDGGSNLGLTFIGTSPYVAFIIEGSNANTYTGLTTVGSNAFLVLNKDVFDGSVAGDVLVTGNGALDYFVSNQIADTATVTVNSTGLEAGFHFAGMELRNFNETIANLFGTGTVGLGEGTLTVGGGDFAGAILDGDFGEGGNLTKIGPGTLILSGPNTYTGVTTIEGGVLRTAAPNTLSQSSPVLIEANGILYLNGFNQTIPSFSDGTTAGGVIDLGAATLTTGSDNLNTQFTGLITGVGGLTKVGTGFLFLGGTNNYTGPTTVHAGAIVLDGFLASPVTLNGGSAFFVNPTGVQTVGDFATAVTAVGLSVVSNSGSINFGDFGKGISAGTGNVLYNGLTITGGRHFSIGVELTGTLNTLTNDAGATISATTAIVIAGPGNNTIVNFGTLIGTGGIAIDASDVTVPVNFVNIGQIPFDLSTLDPKVLNIINFGGIDGGVLFGAADDTFTLVTGMPPTGILDGGGGVNSLRLVGTGSETLDLNLTRNFNTLTKDGAGTWILNGVGTFPGGTSIDLGTINLQGKLISNVTVQRGGLLVGNGIIAGNLTNHGTVSPGNLVGKLTVTRDYVQSGSGRLVIEVTGKKAGEYDVLEVHGRAKLDGTLNIERIGNGPHLKVGEKLEFLTAPGGVEGKFSDVNNALTIETMVNQEVIYLNDGVALVGTQGSYVEFAERRNLSVNQRATARVVDAAAFGGKETRMVTHLNSRELGEIPRDLDAVAPEELTAVYRVGMALSGVQHQNLQHRMDDLRLSNRRPTQSATSGYPMNVMMDTGAQGATMDTGAQGDTGMPAPPPPAPPKPKDRWGTFFTGTGQLAKAGRTDNSRGYEMETGGLTVGIDYLVTPNFAIGIAAGYTNTGANLPSDGRIEINGGKLATYATWFTDDGFHLDTIASTGFNSYETRRGALGSIAHGKTDGVEFSALAGAGYDWRDEALTIGPVGTLEYTRIGFDAFDERGSLAPLRIPGQHASSFRSTLGLKGAYDWELWGKMVRPEFHLAWKHEFGDRSFSLDSTLESTAGGIFTVYDSAAGRDSVLLGAGLSVIWNPSTLMYLFYDGDLGRKESEAHNLSGGMRLTF
jgi:outer membrane autotransporter protein